MRKIYKSGAGLSLNIVIGNGKHRHITFDKHSDGSSSYVTDDESIQKGLESHYLFGVRFGIYETAEVKPVIVEQSTSKEERPKFIEVEVSDISAAKEYIADNFGVSRTMLRTKSAIVEQAKAHGVVFVGI